MRAISYFLKTPPALPFSDEENLSRYRIKMWKKANLKIEQKGYLNTDQSPETIGITSYYNQITRRHDMI